MATNEVKQTALILAATETVCAVLLIVGYATPNWVQISTPEVQMNMGLFKACVSGLGVDVDVCLDYKGVLDWNEGTEVSTWWLILVVAGGICCGLFGLAMILQATMVLNNDWSYKKVSYLQTMNAIGVCFGLTAFVNEVLMLVGLSNLGSLLEILGFSFYLFGIGLVLGVFNTVLSRRQRILVCSVSPPAVTV